MNIVDGKIGSIYLVERDVLIEYSEELKAHWRKVKAEGTAKFIREHTGDYMRTDSFTVMVVSKSKDNKSVMLFYEPQWFDNGEFKDPLDALEYRTEIVKEDNDITVIKSCTYEDIKDLEYKQTFKPLDN